MKNTSLAQHKPFKCMPFDVIASYCIEYVCNISATPCLATDQYAEAKNLRQRHTWHSHSESKGLTLLSVKGSSIRPIVQQIVSQNKSNFEFMITSIQQKETLRCCLQVRSNIWGVSHCVAGVAMTQMVHAIRCLYAAFEHPPAELTCV
jgi:hypothetical protein